MRNEVSVAGSFQDIFLPVKAWRYAQFDCDINGGDYVERPWNLEDASVRLAVGINDLIFPIRRAGVIIVVAAWLAVCYVVYFYDFYCRQSRVLNSSSRTGAAHVCQKLIVK